MLAVLAALTWPHRPAPLSPAAAWSQRAAARVDALAVDIASAAGQNGLSPATADRLRRDLARAEQAGPPPDHPRAEVWARVLGGVDAAVSDAESDPSAAAADLSLAGLEISGLGSQSQAIGVAGPKPAGPG